MTTHIKSALLSIELLRDLPAVYLDQLASFAMIRSVRAGETIFCQGEPSPYIFGILKGEVSIQRVPRDRRQPPKILSVIGPGALFGESSFFAESPRAAMATATRDGELVAILGMKLREWINKEPSAGVPLVMGMLESTLARLRQTSGDLSIIYSIGRLLGSQKPFSERLAAALEYLKNSIEGVSDVILYQRSSYWEEFEPIWTTPEIGTVPVLPLASPLAAQASAAVGAVELKSDEQKQALANPQFPWPKLATAVLVPLIEQEQSGHPLQGMLLMTSRERPQTFSTNTLLLLTSVAFQIMETLSRHRRQEDTHAQNRLNESRKSIQL